MEPVPGSAAHAAAAAVAAAGPSSVAGPSASSARASPYPHGGARMASSGVASPGPAAGGAGGMGSPAPGAGGDGVGELFPPCSLGFLQALTLRHVHLSLRQWRLPEPAIRPLALRRPTPEVQYLTCPTRPVLAEDASRTQVGVGKKTNQRGRGDVDCWRVDGRWVVVRAPFGFQHALVLTDPLDGSFFFLSFSLLLQSKNLPWRRTFSRSELPRSLLPHRSRPPTLPPPSSQAPDPHR